MDEDLENVTPATKNPTCETLLHTYSETSARARLSRAFARSETDMKIWFCESGGFEHWHAEEISDEYLQSESS